MLAKLRQYWEDFKASRPGRRFQDIHKRRKRENSTRNTVRKWGLMGVGLVLTLAGVFFLAVPGPGTIILAIGLVIIAGESLTMARVLDWLEVKLRPLYEAIKKRWRRSSPAMRMAVSALASLAALAVAVAGYLYMSR